MDKEVGEVPAGSRHCLVSSLPVAQLPWRSGWPDKAHCPWRSHWAGHKVTTQQAAARIAEVSLTDPKWRFRGCGFPGNAILLFSHLDRWDL